jgi:hypothetical protein
MRQVPYYLIIGSGRVASHFKHYFSLLNLSYSFWHRKQPISSLYQELKRATHILLLISDHAINSFFTEHLQQHSTDLTLIHFSGSLVLDHVYGAHPLMTFSRDLYHLEQYQSIPFIVDHDAPSFADLLPGLPNPHMQLHKSLKPKYHALCVLSGNFSCMLWQKLFNTLEDEFHIPKTFAFSYLNQQMNNLLTNSITAMTGPLVRRDVVTIEKNIAALECDPFQKVYESFVICYEKIKRSEA